MIKVAEEIRMGDTATPYVAAADGALRAAGIWDGETWMLLGLSGLGFHLVADAGTCPSSPTGYDWSKVHADAMRRIGVTSRCVECLDAERYDAARDEAIAMAKASLDRGVPCVFRTFDWAEFGILTGYDDGDGVFFTIDISGSADPVLFANLGRPHGHPFLHVQVFDEKRPFDLEQAATDALRYGVACWNGDGWRTSYGSGYRVGAEGYETLIAALERRDSDPLGLRYILRILADARAGVAKFVRHVADEGLVSGVAAVADRYEEVAKLVGHTAELMPAAPPFERPLDVEAVPEVSALLRKAANAEAAAIEGLKQI